MESNIPPKDGEKKRNKTKRYLAIPISVLILIAMLYGYINTKDSTIAGDSNGKNSEIAQPSKKTSLKIGTSSVSIALAESGVATLEAMGYKVEVIVFEDYYIPNAALAEGSIDANFYQHLPFMDLYNKSNGTDIIMLEPKLYEFYGGLYSVHADSIENLPGGGIIGIANDASNLNRDLMNLQTAGIISLSVKPQAEGGLYSILDIVDNPRDFKIIQSDNTKYHNLEDYAAVLGTSNTMAAYKIDPTENCLMRFPEPEHAQGICILPENKNTQWVKDMMEAYMSDEARSKVPPESGFTSPLPNNAAQINI